MHHKLRLWMGDEVHQREAACGPVWLKHKRWLVHFLLFIRENESL